jgi:hypothetical protein
MAVETPGLELSQQHLAASELTQDVPTSMHLPLPELAQAAPNIDDFPYDYRYVQYPFSNDVCTASYFEQLAVRTETPEYRNAQNRVAVLVGESALAANLKYIPEETIVLLDSSPDMSVFMDIYVQTLREARSPEDWIAMLADSGPDRIDGFMRNQLYEWFEEGRPHPLVDYEEFYEAQRIAKEKTIITWTTDITSPRDLAALGRALREHQAQITMMNLTNVLPYVETFRDPRDCAAQLAVLPVTPNAPILTTAIRMEPRTILEALQDDSSKSSNIPTGPFFGLDNLARANMPDARHELGALVERNMARSSAETEQIDPDQIIVHLLQRALGLHDDR